MIMEMKVRERTHVVILAIGDVGDVSNGSCIEIPEGEKRRSGLSEFRSAYVQVAEYNVDQTPDSLHYNPASPALGHFSKPFIAQIGRALAANLRNKRAIRIDRQ